MDPIKVLELQRQLGDLQVRLAIDKYETTLRIKALETGDEEIIKFINQIVAEGR